MPSLLTIPEAHRKPLHLLALMSNESRAILVDTIRSATAILDTEDLILCICDQTDLGREEASPISRMLMSMYRVADQTREAFHEQVIETARGIFHEDANSIDWSSFSKDLADILDCHDSLGVAAKVSELRREFGRLFCSARILSDIRPVFGANPEGVPLAAAIIHTLRVTYHDGDDHRDFHVAMSAADLLQLRHLVDRALKKETALSTEIAKTDMRYLEMEAE